MTRLSVCVYCGSRPGEDFVYSDAAQAVGGEIGQRGWQLVYGGGRAGLMGVVADAALAAGASVVGVIPQSLMSRELGHTGLNELHVVETMHERKMMMAERSDAFLALPGGIGTFEELFEVWSWRQLGYHDKPLGLLNVAGYYGALLGFLPKLCEHLLGETLLMPSVATWWCGEPAALEDVISRLDRLVFKSSFPQQRQVPVFGQDLDASARQAFIARLRADPHNFVAQEMLRVSQAPIWRSMERRARGRAGPLTGGGIPDLRLSGAIGPNSAGRNTLSPGLGASAVGLRVFACATANGYQVMPGGLTRVATGADARVISMQSGGGSKDTWVLSDGVVDQRTLLNRPTASHDLVRGDAHLASRTVENLFWLGRHSERCDDIARLMRRIFDSLIETTPQTRGNEWPTTLALCQWYGLLDADIFTDDPTIEARLLAAVHDSDTPGLAYQVHLLFRAAFNLRERLSADNWRALNRLLRTVSQPDPKLNIGDALALLDDATASLMTLTGFALDGMTRDMGWRFLSIGRRLERLQFMCTLIQHALTMPADSNLEWLLELGDSIITYRARYMSRPEWLPVLDLLLLDADNPRSVSFQLHGLSGYLTRLETIHGPCGHDLIEPVMLQLRSLDAARDLRPGGELLLGLMRQLYDTSFQLSERLSARFLSYSGALSGFGAGSLIKA